MEENNLNLKELTGKEILDKLYKKIKNNLKNKELAKNNIANSFKSFRNQIAQ